MKFFSQNDGINKKGGKPFMQNFTVGPVMSSEAVCSVDGEQVPYENLEENKRFFNQLDGEGIRYEIVAFAKAVESGRDMNNVPTDISEAIVGVIEDFNARKGLVEIGECEIRL